MDNLTAIRKRINKGEKKKSILPFFSCFMALLSIFMGFLIYAKKDENGKFLKENFGVSVNFNSLNTKLNNIVDDLFNFNLLNENNDEEKVTNQVMYLQLDNNEFCTDSSEIKMLNNGTILGVYKEDYTYTVLVSYNNGVLASYSNLSDVKVKQFDELDKGESLANYEESFRVLFKKDGELITYNEAFE